MDGGTPGTWSGGGTVSVISGVANITPFPSTTNRCSLDLTDGWNDLVKDVDYTEAGSGSAGDNMTAVTNLIPMGVAEQFIRTRVSE